MSPSFTAETLDGTPDTMFSLPSLVVVRGSLLAARERGTL